ncbi:MAG: hypothetical protein F6K22_27535 [Okeania sp. SIO2F4]|uniref:hypothetical protein n=1 Tax=Okeania sp. SIO2F4 TaxID=2607790 RepID=UPI00142AE403|nr:hypothetical protein [Okeania sp. SIO2F4]NES06234.1 hypothetical protein [Okeania sp. SIO2F4]
MNISTIKQGEWVEIRAKNHPLRGEICQAQEVAISTVEVYHQGHGLVKFRLKDTKQVSPPKHPPITPHSIVARIESLINRYQQIGGTVDRKSGSQASP